MSIRSYKLSASLICANILRLENEIDEIVNGGCDYIHFDVMDGLFVPRFGMYPEILTAVRSMTKIPVDVHLMVANPENYIDVFARAGASLITVHVETCHHLHRTVQLIKHAGVQAGVSVNFATPLSTLDYIVEDVDLVLIMAINPGIVGHALIPQAIKKINNLKDKLFTVPNNVLIQVDGGVTFDSAPKMLDAGADILVCGSSTIFRPDATVSDKIWELKKHLQKFGY
jgi:ribulose-phosphate 3-epimerase